MDDRIAGRRPDRALPDPRRPQRGGEGATVGARAGTVRGARWRQLSAALVVTLAASGGCGETARIRIAAASTAGRLVFEIDTATVGEGVTAFRVDACDARGVPPRAHWLARADAGASSLVRIEYGTPPPGWRSVEGPEQLTPGCYRAAISRAPPLEFDVTAGGAVRER